MRYYDAEAFSAVCSDIMVFETEHLQDYTFLIEALRDSALFSRPYFRLKHIIPAVEDGFRDYEAHLDTGDEQARQ